MRPGNQIERIHGASASDAFCVQRNYTLNMASFEWVGGLIQLLRRRRLRLLAFMTQSAARQFMHARVIRLSR